MAGYGFPPPLYKRPEEICIRLHRRSPSSVETNSAAAAAAAAMSRFWPRVKTESAKNNTPSSSGGAGYYTFAGGRRKIVTGPVARAPARRLMGRGRNGLGPASSSRAVIRQG